jgi:beta-glucosidase
MIHGYRWALFLAGTWLASAVAQAQVPRDPQIDALIAKMTIEEKAGQLTIIGDASKVMGDINPEAGRRKVEDFLQEIRKGRVGALMSGNGAESARSTQKIAIEESRLKIPLLFAADVIHGYRTVFPIPLGEAASFEPDLAERTARVAAIEATANGLQWTFAPMVDIARDQRWGRVAEGAGEDVYLGKLFAAARVRGFQGNDLRAENSLLSTPKHFAGYGAVSGGMDYNTTEIAEHTFREIHLPPFQAAYAAGALSTMSSFNDINGVPASANRWLMTKVLREELGFTGFVVSDYTADKELILHGYAEDDADATRLALTAGVDMSMVSGLYVDHLPKLVQSGAVPMAVVDESVRRVLHVKKALGLFDNPYRSLNPARLKEIGTPEHRALARDAARRSVVLLRNAGGVLPLKRDARIALIGPLGDDRKNLFGTWTLFGESTESITLKEGLARAGARQVSVTKGSDIEAEIKGGIAAAVAAAKQADVVVLAIGESEHMNGEAQSRTDIVVPEPQQRLAEAVAATGKPVVVLLSTGRALALKGAVRDANAIVVNWFLGSEAGNALADVLFGDYNPSGRLPVSFPHESGQQPYFYNHRATGRPFTTKPEFTARYRETANTALYPFGHGIGYSKIAYGDVRLSATTLAWDGKLTATARVTNGGTRAGEEVAQLYIYDRVASVTRPIRELKGFQKFKLEPGQSKEVSFELTRKDLEFVGLDNTWIAEPGAFDVWIAPSSSAGKPATFKLTR